MNNMDSKNIARFSFSDTYNVWHDHCYIEIMPTKRSNISRNRTLLILLGIILACLLTFNARSFYLAEALPPSKVPDTHAQTRDKNTSLIEKIDFSSIKSLTKKFHF